MGSRKDYRAYNETPTDWTIMPKNKFSILTTAMQKAEAKTANKTVDELIHPSEEAAGKRALVKWGLVVAGTFTATMAAIILVDKMDKDETTTEA